MTLGNAASACVRLIVCCWDCGHQVETEPAAMAKRYGPETTVYRLVEVARVFGFRKPRYGGDRNRAALVGPEHRGVSYRIRRLCWKARISADFSTPVSPLVYPIGVSEGKTPESVSPVRGPRKPATRQAHGRKPREPWRSARPRAAAVPIS
jgi:hypothetical protein